MIYVKETFSTKADAEKYKENYLNAYHPCGYGTVLSIQEKDGKFIVNGSRYSSCD